MKRIILIAILMAACGGGDDAPANDFDAAVPADAPSGPPDADCVENPQTSQEILNACTDAERIDKEPELPLLEDDGSLPPLPE